MEAHDRIHKTPAMVSAKAAARTAGLAARASLDTSTRAAATQAVTRELERYRRRRGFTTVCAYAAIGTELVLDAWLATVIDTGVGVFLPRVVDDGLQLFRVRNLDGDLSPGHRGVREPRPRGRRPARVDRIDTFVVPGAAFDAQGGRVGYGGGHFDRLLEGAAPAACRIGVAFEAQLLAAVPREPHDVAMHAVVTERRAIVEC